jgi:hypothetical protein
VSIAGPHDDVVYFVIGPDRSTLSEIARRVDAGDLRPVIGITVPLAEGRTAFAPRQSRPGKRVLVPTS